MTDQGIELAGAMAWPHRGGFWRRFFAALIDYLVVMIPLFALVAVLFQLTEGGVKGHFWLNWKLCSSATVHGNQSLERYNWQMCRTSFLGFPVTDWAAGTATDAQDGKAETVSIDLDSKGNFRPAALDLGFLELPVLAIYLFVIEMMSGQSVGKRALSLVVRDEYDWQRVGLPPKKAARRQVIKFLGTVPSMLTGAWFAFQSWRSVPGPVPNFSQVEIVCAVAASVLVLIWPAWIGLSIALGNEPIHDRVAGTTVRISETKE